MRKGIKWKISLKRPSLVATSFCGCWCSFQASYTTVKSLFSPYILLFIHVMAKMYFQQPLLQSVSHDPSEIILLCWFEFLLLSMLKTIVLFCTHTHTHTHIYIYCTHTYIYTTQRRKLSRPGAHQVIISETMCTPERGQIVKHKKVDSITKQKNIYIQALK